MKIWKHCLGIGCWIILAEACLAQSIIVNGGFEDPAIPSNTSQDVDPTGWSRIPSPFGFITHLFNGNGGISGVPMPHGGNQQFLLGQTGSGISQKVILRKPNLFRLNWWTAIETDPIGSTALTVYSAQIWSSQNLELIASNLFEIGADSSWVTGSMEIYLEPGSYVVEFRTFKPYFHPAIFLDDVTIVPVADSAQETNQGHHQSGITGQVVGLPTFIRQCRVHIVSSDGGKVDADILTGSDFRFQIALKPGVYTLVPYVVNAPPLFIPPGSPIVLRVEKKDFTEVVLNYTAQPQ